MKFFPLRWIFLIAVLFAIYFVNNRYEIFALNMPKNQGSEKSEGSFRVMTYNINAPFGNEDIENIKAKLLYDIDKYEPDILCIQELSSSFHETFQASLDSIFGYSDSMAIRKEALRHNIYSKKPIKNFRRYRCVTEIDPFGVDSVQKEIYKLKKIFPVFSSDIEVESGKWITLFSVHLRSSAYSTARRSMEEGSSWSDGISLYLENYKIGKKIRDYEADNFRFYLDSLETKDTPIIIAGDFNDWSGSYSLNRIRNGIYFDAWWEGGFGFGITYDGWHLKLRLDHILYSYHFKQKNVFVGKKSFSDHCLLISDFGL